MVPPEAIGEHRFRMVLALWDLYLEKEGVYKESLPKPLAILLGESCTNSLVRCHEVPSVHPASRGTHVSDPRAHKCSLKVWVYDMTFLMKTR